jgi:filamentous hemagglutinin
MNKLRYRIIFNKTRGMCMAVQETARSRTKARGQGVIGSSVPGATGLPALRRLTFLLRIGLGGVVLCSSALAQIVADPKVPGQQRATVLNAANGVLQVNIQTPSTAGVSRNVYSQFDVPRSGVVLNNSRTNVQTQLGGWVQGNPWLSKGTARVILNEVNSSDPSRLQGFIEVAGDRAETIIANPAGIVVDGSGFINVSRATLTTGSPILDDGRLKGYSVQRGQIVIDGDGLDASKPDYTALIARTLQVNAGLWAQRLNVIAGVNQVEEAAQAKVTQVGQAADSSPLYAVDVARLGGMYANQIYLVGTEAGVGVRNAGGIGAVAGDLIVTASGRLENAGTLSASKRLQASSASIDNQDAMRAGETLTLATGRLVNAGRINAGQEALIAVQGDINNEGGHIEAARIDLTGANLHNARGNIAQTGLAALAIDATQLNNVAGTLGQQSEPADGGSGDTTYPGTIVPPADPGTTGGQGSPTDQSGGVTPGTTAPVPILANGRMTFQVLDNNGGLIATNGNAVLRTEALDNQDGKVYVNSLSVAGSAFDNSGGTLTVLRNFDAHTASFFNDQGKLLVGSTFNGGLGFFSNRHGLLQAGQLALEVLGHLDNSNGTLRQVGDATAAISVGRELSLEQGRLDLAGGLRLRAGTVSGNGSMLNVTGDLTLESGMTSASQGNWRIGGDASLRTGALDNNVGKISTAGTLRVESVALNNAGGAITAGASAAISTRGAFDNSRGNIQAEGNLALIATGGLDNQAGNIEALASDSAMSVTAAAIDNHEGRIANAGAGATTLEAEVITNSGVIGGNGNVGIAASSLRNEGAGSITSLESMAIALRSMLDNAGRIDAGGDIRIAQDKGQLRNHGTLVALGDVEIAAAAIDNTGGKIGTLAGRGGQVSMQATTLENADGVISADGLARIDIRGGIGNERGHIRASGDLALNAGTRIENHDGTIETAGSMQAHGGEIGNQGGRIAASGAGASFIEADRSIDNNGLIGTNGRFTVKAETLLNGPEGAVSASGDLELAVLDRICNDGGIISTAGALRLDQAAAKLVNTGAITAAASSHLNLDQVNNDRGTINTLRGSLDLRANALSNLNGRVMAGGDASLFVKGDIDNGAGDLQAAGSLDTQAGGVLHNAAGVIEALGKHATLAVRAAAFENTGGRIVDVGDGAASVSAAGHIDNSGLIAANGRLDVAAATIDNAGTVSSTDKIELAVSSALNNSGTISAATGLHTDQANAQLRNSGTIIAGGLLEMAVSTIDNAGGRIVTAQGSDATMLLGAQSINNQGGAIMADGNATFLVVDGFNNRSGLVQAKSELQLSARGLVDSSGGTIETLSADSTLQLHAGALLNEAGSIVNAGNGLTQVKADTALVNSGQIFGNGTLNLEAESVVNSAQGSVVAGDALTLQAHASLENAGTISSRGDLTIDQAGAALSNHGSVVANGDIVINAAAIDNTGGTIATASGSGASVTLQGASLSNWGGRIVAERALNLGVDGALDNSQGFLQGADTVKATAGGKLTNDSGVIEATGAGATIALQVNAVHNSGGRIVNVGQGAMSVTATDTVENSGLVASNGTLDLHAATLVNEATGTLTSGDAMKLGIGARMVNAGIVNSGGTLHIAAQRAEVRNRGMVVANGALAVISGAFDNDDGQLATAKDSAAGLQVDAASISNRGGAMLADRDARVSSADTFDNAGGTLQAAGSLQISAAGAAGNDGGVIETLGPSASLNFNAGILDNGSGRIVNVGIGVTTVVTQGKLSNRGLVAGNGNLQLGAADLDNQAGASLVAGTSLAIAATRTVGNAGVVSAQGHLTIDAAQAAVHNSGQIVSAAGATLDTASFDNAGGQVVTVAGSGGNIELHASALANVGGVIIADGATQITSGGALENRLGAIRANSAMSIEATGTLGNQDGVIEVANAGATLDVRAGAIDNSTGRLVNVGSGATRVGAVDDLLNSGILAGNGSVDLSGATVRNLAVGTIAAGGALDLHVHQALDNAGIVSAARALSMDEAGARIVNNGQITAGDRIALHGASIDNDSGQIGTQTGDIILSSESTLGNRAGSIGAPGNVTISAKDAYDNSQGQVQTPGRLKVSVGGTLANAGGALEAVGAASTLVLQAGSVANTAGRIINAGTGATSIESLTGVDNSGMIAGNGALALTAQTLHNTSSGMIGSGDTLELAVHQQLVNAGSIGSNANLHFDQAAASFSNTGRVGAGGAIDITAASLGNQGGQLYTARNSGAAISLHAGSLENTTGTISADGLLLASVAGSAGNSDGTLHGATGTTLSVGGVLANGSGTIETATGPLAVQAGSVDNSGRIINGGAGTTTIESATSIVNSGAITGNDALVVAAQSLQNTGSGTIGTGGTLELAVRQQLVNAGTISSGGTLHFDQAAASLSNSGRIGAGSTIDISTAAVSNQGGQLYTLRNSGAAINLRTGSLDNSNGTVSADGLMAAEVGASVANSGGTLHGGTGTTLNVDGALANGSGTIETASGALVIGAQSIENNGRIANAGIGAATITSVGAIVNSGTIGGSGTLDLHASGLDNRAGGQIMSGRGLELAMSQRLDNAGVISGGASVHFDQAAANFSNAGRIGANGTIDIAAGTINNRGGQVYTVNGSGGAINLHTGSVDNTGGTVSADGLLLADVGDSIANGAGILHGGTGTTLHMGDALNNGNGAVEAGTGALEIQAHTIDSSGRIVNAGTGQTTINSTAGIANSGTIGGNGVLALRAPGLWNQTGGLITSGGMLLLDVRQQLVNVGTVSSGGTLSFEQSGASFANSGQIAAAGDIRLTATSFDNNGGQISTVHGSNGDITVTTSALTNRNGAILADGNATFNLSGAADNYQGTLQAGANLSLTTPGAISNDGGVIEALGAASGLTLDGAALDNGNGRISNVGSGDTRLLSQTSITNAGTIAAMGNLLLSGQTMSNQAGATVASGEQLALAITQQLGNQGKINSGGTLTFDQAGATFANNGEVYSGGNAVINASQVNNDDGRLGTGSGSAADLTLTSQQLSNQGGRIATDRDLVVNTHTVNAMGELFGGRDLSLAMDGDFTRSDSLTQIHSNRNLSLSVSGNITNTSTLGAAGTLTLSGQQINNLAGASIEGTGVILKASGNLTNTGEINGVSTVDIVAANVSNSGGIVGGNVTLATGNLDNSGAAALIGATGTLGLGVAGTLDNTGGATLYSSGDIAIGGLGGGSAGAVNNISSTIEAVGSIALSASSLSNVRENVQIVQVKTVDESVHMSMPSWYQYGDNHDSFETSAANYRPSEVYFVSPSDILDDQVLVTPDGYTIHRAVVRTHANDSAFYIAESGLYRAYGAQARLTLSEGTQVIYYTESAQVANPDQGGPPSNAFVHAEDVTHWASTVGFSNQYGNCSTDCIRLVTQPDYTDPRTTILRDNQRALAPVKEQLEASREAHHVAVEDRLAPGAGAAAQILASGDMHLSVSNTFTNNFGDIKASGSLVIDGGAPKDNVAATLYRTHTFDGTWRTYGGQTVSYQQPRMSEAIGSVGGVIRGDAGVSISGRSFSNVDVTAGTVANIRDAINVIGSGVSGANTAGAQLVANTSAGGTVGADLSAGAGVAGATGIHVVAGAGTAGAASGQVSGNAMAGPVGLAGAVAATGANSGLSASPNAAPSGIVNRMQAGGKSADSGYANEAAVSAGAETSGAINSLLVNGVVDQGGTSNNGSLSGPVTSTGNVTQLGNVLTTRGSSAAQQAGGVRGTGLGSVTKVAPSGLFIRNPDANGSYLFETRPQFANQQQWTSSDYLLKQLEFDPATMQKRLGDGFYEQRLVREQLAELTGHASDGGSSDDSIYMQLLTNAVSFAREFGLRPGLALSAEQVSHLTSDIVWMESQTVMLPDGSVDTVLAPKVYLAHIGQRALQLSGALVTGNGVTIETSESIVNRGGVIDGGHGRTLLVAARDIVNQGGTIKGGSVALAADRDVKNQSLAVKETYDFKLNSGTFTSQSNQATISATGALDIVAGRDLNDEAGKITAGSATLTAGRNISFDAIQTGSTYQSGIGGYTEKDSSITHALSQISTGGDLKIAATGGLNLIGTQVSTGTAGSGAGQLLAGGAINIAAVTNEVNTSVQNDPRGKQYDKQVQQIQTVVGAGVAAAGNLTVAAGMLDKGSLTISSSALSAGDALKLTATDSVNIVSTQEQHLLDTAKTRSSSSFFKSKTTQQADYVASSRAIGSSLSGKTVEISAGKDINVLGSAVAGEGDVSLAAVGGVNIAASTSTLTEQHHTQVKESGFLSGGGFGFSIGTRTTTTDQGRDATTQSGQSRSMVGSLGGNLDIVAGEAIKVSGSDLAAAMNMNLMGRSVTIDPGQDNLKGKFEQTQVQDGLTLAIGGSAVNAVQTVQGMSSAASQSKDSRVQALAAAAAALGVKDAAADMAKNGLNVNVSLTVGHSESKYTETTSSLLNSGSVLNAGNDITIRASGAGKDSNVSVIGSDLNAKGNITLKADNQVNLLAAQDQESQHSNTQSMSAAVGIGASIGTKGTSIGLTASASASWGNVDGDGATQVNSHVNAGDRLTITSGGDTNLKGAVASGGEVVVDVKGNLNIESLQDRATLDGKRQSASVSGTLGGPSAGLSASASQSKVHNDFASVQEQSGIRAGDGGFQVQVAGNTDLKGGVISSSEQAIKDGRNSVATGTLTFSDIQNRDSTQASGVSLGVNVGKNQNGSTFSPSLAPGIGQVSGSQGSVTRSGISAGALIVADEQAGQPVAHLNRDVTTGKDTAGALAKAWTGAQALDEVGAQMQITSAAMPRLAKEIGDYAARKVEELKGNPEEAAKWAEGGIYRVAAHAVLGALGGGLEGALGAGSSAAAAPIIAKAIKDAGLPEGAREAAITAVGAALGAVAGGTAGAVTGGNQIANNYLRQHGVGIKKSEQAQFDNAVAACNNGDQSACERRDNLIALSQQRDQLITNACAFGPAADCSALVSAATSAGNKTIFGSDGKAVVYPFGAPELRPTPNVLDGTLHDQLAKSTLDGLLMASGDAAVAKVAALVGKGVVAAADAAKIVGGGSSIESAAGQQALATSINNFYRDGASPSLIQETFNQAAVSSTHNSAAMEVILGKYIRGSADSYEAVAQARGATYFSMSDWNVVESQLGAEQMWNINKSFLNQQMAQGKTFLFTGDPASASAGYFTKLEFQHLKENGYVLVMDGRFFRAIKK